MLGSCPSVSGVAGTARRAPRDRCYSSSFPSKWLHWSPPNHSGETDPARGREEKHLPAGMWKERKGHLQGWGSAGAPLGAFSSVCFVLPPLQWVFSWAIALLWSENYDQASGLLASELTPQLCPPDNGVLSAQDWHEGTRHGLVT